MGLQKPSDTINTIKPELKSSIPVWDRYIIFCISAAVMGVFLVYPFIGLIDGFSRWNLAMEILENGKIISDTLLSPIIPYIQAFTYKITNSYALYTFIQAVTFYLSIGLVTYMILKDKTIQIMGKKIFLWIIVAIVATLVPTTFVFPLLLTDSAPVFALMIYAFFLLKKEKNKTWHFVLYWLLLFFTIALCVGIRINSIVLIAFLLMVQIIKERHSIKLMLYNISALLFGIIAGLLIPQMLIPNTYNGSTLGMVWELTSMAEETGDENLINELDSFGDAEKALERYRETALNSLVWDNEPPFSAYEISGIYSGDVTKLYVKQLITNPRRFLKIKLRFIYLSLGLRAPLITSRRGVYEVENVTMHYGALKTNRQKQIRELFFNFTDAISIISLRPFIAFLLCGILSILTWLKNKKETDRLWLLGIAVVYYSSFLINTQAFEFRYYAPSFYLVLVIMISEIFEFIYIASGKVKGRLKKENAL